MCGFFGIIENDRGIDIDKANQALVQIKHRGPDYTGVKSGDNFYLGHNRLSIIDLSASANQPFEIEEASIIYNGEVYNYQELKKSLPGNYRSNSDTEVILKGYRSEGPKFFSRLRGIYSLAIVDHRENNKVILARDPSGIKPLYYHRKGDSLAFASEIKAILHYYDRNFPINEKVLGAFIHLGYCPEPETAFSGINSLKPGNYIEFNEDSITESSFFKVGVLQNNNYSFNENKERVEYYLGQSLKRNLVSDVPCTIALSGGIDSSLIYYYANQIDSGIEGITVSFNKDEKYDESPISKNYADHIGGKIRTLEVGTLNLSSLNKLIDHFDQPFADSSLVPVFFLTEASRNVSKVLLGGDGGDELFNGYPFMTLSALLGNHQMIHRFVSSAGLLKRFLGKGSQRKVDRVEQLKDKSIQEMIFYLTSWLPPGSAYEKKSVFNHDLDIGLRYYLDSFSEERPESNEDIVVFDFYRKILLGDYLRKTDMMAMLNGVELRVPFLDEDLVQFAFTIPFDQKSSVFQTKKILRHIHNKLYDGKGSKLSKMGFTIPLDTYLTQQEKLEINNTLLKPGNFIENYIDKSYIKFLCNEFLNYKSYALVSRDSVFQRIFMLYALQRWAQINHFD